MPRAALLPKILNRNDSAWMMAVAGDRRLGMKCPLPVRNKRRVLCVFPIYTPAFGTFQHAYKLMYRVKAFMPPQGLLLIAAYMPESWPVRFVDENIAPATDADFAWADVVMVTGMHIQAEQIHDIARRAHGGRQGRRCWAGRRSRHRPRCIRTSTISTSARWATRPTQIIRALDESAGAARAQQVVVQDQGAPAAHRVPDCRPTTRCRSAAICSARCSSRPAARISASSATSPASTAASRA